MFFKDAEKPLYGLEIAQTLNASPGTTHRELNAMIEQGILKKKKEGALVMYRLNTHHPYFHELKKAIFPAKRPGNRVLFISDARLSLDTPKDLIADLMLFFDYAQENASELVFVGDMLETLKSDVFRTYLHQKSLFDRLVELSHHVQITNIIGHYDTHLSALAVPGAGGRFFDSKIIFAKDYHHPKLSIFAAHERTVGSPDSDAAYMVFGGSPKAQLKETGQGITFYNGSWKMEKKRQFVEIDKDGGALVAVEDLR